MSTTMSGKQDPNFATQQMWKAARERKRRELRRWIMDEHVDMYALCPRTGQTILMFCASSGYHMCVKELLKKGVDVRQTSKHGGSALMCAAWGGSKECVSLLLGQSDVHAIDERGLNALMLTCRGYWSGTFELLLPISDINAVDREGMNALMMACQTNTMECVKVLVEHMSIQDIKNVKDKQGMSALDWAFRSLSSEPARFLKRYIQIQEERQLLERGIPFQSQEVGGAEHLVSPKKHRVKGL